MKSLPRITFPKEWGFEPPRNTEEWYLEEVSVEAAREIEGIIHQIANSPESAKGTLEKFGRAFSASVGGNYLNSSDVGWAGTDLNTYLMDARSNPPKFLRTFVDALNSVRDERTDQDIPELPHLNTILETHRLGYIIQPDGRLTLRADYIGEVDTEVPALVKARAELESSWEKANGLLVRGKPREALEAIWWVVESMTADFSGTSVAGVPVRGTYFNDVMKDIKKAYPGTVRHRALSLLEQIQHWLSDPKQLGIRHGASSTAQKVELPEARLIVGLVREYAKYLTHLAQEVAPPGMVPP